MDRLVEKCKQINPSANRDFVSKKFHNIRCSFRRELKKIKDSKSTGSGGDVYVPSIWYFDMLSFITDTEIPRRGLENISGVESDVDSNDNDGGEVSNTFL